jgi:acyl-CoA reductase-like NAD-dependent aldehyde dehydrogenase
MVASIGHYIGNKPVTGKSGRTGDITNPATGEVTAKVAFASVEEVDAAVQVAKKAQATTSRVISRSSTARRSTTPRARLGAGWRSSSSPAASPIT